MRRYRWDPQAQKGRKHTIPGIYYQAIPYGSSSSSGGGGGGLLRCGKHARLVKGVDWG